MSRCCQLQLSTATSAGTTRSSPKSIGGLVRQPHTSSVRAEFQVEADGQVLAGSSAYWLERSRIRSSRSKVDNFSSFKPAASIAALS